MGRHNFYFRVIELCRAVFGALSLIFIIGSVCLLFFWLLSSDYYYQIKPFRSSPVVVNQKGSIFETSLIVVGSGQAVFERWVEDEDGKVVHRYPDYKISSNSENHVNQGIIYIPNLPLGKYVIKAKLFYKPNPIKISQVNIILGTFVITN